MSVIIGTIYRVHEAHHGKRWHGWRWYMWPKKQSGAISFSVYRGLTFMATDPLGNTAEQWRFKILNAQPEWMKDIYLIFSQPWEYADLVGARGVGGFLHMRKIGNRQH